MFCSPPCEPQQTVSTSVSHSSTQNNTSAWTQHNTSQAPEHITSTWTHHQHLNTSPAVLPQMDTELMSGNVQETWEKEIFKVSDQLSVLL